MSSTSFLNHAPNFSADIDRLINRVRPIGDWSADERAAFRRVCAPPKLFLKNSSLASEGAETSDAMFILQGWAFSSVSTGSGERRILEFLMPGDVVGLPSRLTGMSAVSVESITDVVATRLTSSTLDTAFKSEPRLKSAFEWLLAYENERLREKMLATLRTNCTARVSWLLLSLEKRSRGICRDQDGYTRCPIRQHHIADALGLTPIHVNRILQALRKIRVIEFFAGRLRILDESRLQRISVGDDIV